MAFHLDHQSVRWGECESGLAMGVSVLLAAGSFVACCAAHMLSQEGRSKTFDQSADGYGRGEGCGSTSLCAQPPNSAHACYSFLTAAVRGSAVNQDGHTATLTAPNGPSQQMVLTAALVQAGAASARDAVHLETHGTGTALGDPIEVGAVKQVMQPGCTEGSPLGLGAVKPNVGHLEGSAGMSVVMKVVLVVKGLTAPRGLHLRRLNEHCLLYTSPSPRDLSTSRMPSSA